MARVLIGSSEAVNATNVRTLNQQGVPPGAELRPHAPPDSAPPDIPTLNVFGTIVPCVNSTPET